VVKENGIEKMVFTKAARTLTVKLDPVQSRECNARKKQGWGREKPQKKKKHESKKKGIWESYNSGESFFLCTRLLTTYRTLTTKGNVGCVYAGPQKGEQDLGGKGGITLKHNKGKSIDRGKNAALRGGRRSNVGENGQVSKERRARNKGKKGEVQERKTDCREKRGVERGIYTSSRGKRGIGPLEYNMKDVAKVDF